LKVVDEFIESPTDVLISYLATEVKIDRRAIRQMIRTGRIAMCMELMTVVKLLEDHEHILVHASECIAVLKTLIRDQDLEEAAESWYHNLNEWRRIKLADDVSEALDALPSEPEVPADDVPLPDSNGAQQQSDQTKDPPSAS